MYAAQKSGFSVLASHRGYFKVQVVMQLAARIEARATRRTNCLAVQVPGDAQLSPARAAQHCLIFEFSRRPNPGSMPCFQFMTVEAAIICAAAVEFHRDDVEFAAVVRAARAPIYREPSYRYSSNRELHVTLPPHDLIKVWRTQQRSRNPRIYRRQRYAVSTSGQVFRSSVPPTKGRGIRRRAAERPSLAKKIYQKDGGGDF
jgi:hypothetical protein